MIFCVGQAAYDVTLPYEGALQVNQKYRVRETHGCSGGPALNAACLCARWGAPSQLVARLGNDYYGDLVRDDLARYGVGLDYMIPDTGATTSYSLIAVSRSSGDRTIFNIPSHMNEVVCPVPRLAPSVILSDGHEPAASIDLIEAFPQVPSVVDAGTYRESTYEVARAVDYLVCSEDFARQYTGEVLEDPQDSLVCDKLLTQIEHINGALAVVTLGSRGVIYRDAEGVPRHMPSFPAHAVDTTGAGDIFHGAFAFGLFQGLTLEQNLRQAQMTASLSVRSMGGLASMPALTEVLRALDEACY